MSVQKVEIKGVGPVTLVKSAQNRSLRLTVTTNGIRVSMPRWTPFSAGRAFAEHHAEWIQRELAKQSTTQLEAGQRIGKLHHLRFEQILDGKPATSRVTGTEVVVRLQAGEHIEDPQVQQRAVTAAARALKREAEQLLPPRLRSLSEKHSLPYKSVSIKSLKRRWGSCDTHRNIVFNLYLMDLPWEYIDYVICHELTHTVHMNHGPEFWKLLTQLNPRARDISRQLKHHQPVVGN